MKGGFNLQYYLNEIRSHVNDDCVNKGEVMDILHDKLKNFKQVDFEDGCAILQKDDNNPKSAKYKLSFKNKDELHVFKLERIDGGYHNENYDALLNDSFSLAYNKNLIRLNTNMTTDDSIIRCDFGVDKLGDGSLKYYCILNGLDREQSILDLIRYNDIREEGTPEETIIDADWKDHYRRIIDGTSSENSFYLKDFDTNNNSVIDEYTFNKKVPIYSAIKSYIKQKELISQISDIVKNDFMYTDEVSFRR